MPTAVTWNVDASHSCIFFAIRHLVIAKVRGKFGRFGGTIELRDDDLTQSKLTLEIDVSSIDTSLELRDAHLRSPDFFDAERFPTATFTSKSITKEGDAYAVLGDFSLRGETHELTLHATFAGKVTDARGRERAVFTATGAVDRAAYGLTWNQTLEAGGVAIGPTAELQIEVEAIRA